DTISELVALGIQCIKDRITLLKTTINTDGSLYKVAELRSAKIPTSWENRIEPLNVYELLACCYCEVMKQQSFEFRLM
ncbi:MAG: hypothetical protein EXX96DRAFT_464882, partial [Benjaminiella poitrasii]